MLAKVSLICQTPENVITSSVVRGQHVAGIITKEGYVMVTI